MKSFSGINEESLIVISIFYMLNKFKNEAIMVEVAVPGQRWEIEFLEDGIVDMEKLLVIKICTM